MPASMTSQLAVNAHAVSDNNVSVKTPAQLTAQERAAWMRLREGNPLLFSPYFHIDYTDMIDSLRGDVRVIIVSDDDGPVAFLPVQGRNFARPVGAPMTDYHGFITSQGTDIDAASVLKVAGIGVYHYSALVDSNGPTSHVPAQIAAAIDISAGAQEWRAAQNGSYKRHYKNCMRKQRRTQRDAGPITLEFKSQDQAAFESMISWKRTQYTDTGKYDVLGAGWTLDMLRTLWERPRFDKAGQRLNCDMHVLRVGDDVAAVDMGLYDGRTYHSWMVSYNKEYYVYSPGMQLLEAIIDEGAALGYDIIDLGVGIEGYKRTYHDIDLSVSSGFIAAGGAAAALSKAYGAAENLSERAPLGKISKLPGKLRRRYSQIAACDPTASGRTKAMLGAMKGAPKK